MLLAFLVFWLAHLNKNIQIYNLLLQTLFLTLFLVHVSWFLGSFNHEYSYRRLPTFWIFGWLIKHEYNVFKFTVTDLVSGILIGSLNHEYSNGQFTDLASGILIGSLRISSRSWCCTSCGMALSVRLSLSSMSKTKSRRELFFGMRRPSALKYKQHSLVESIVQNYIPKAISELIQSRTSKNILYFFLFLKTKIMLVWTIYTCHAISCIN